jgi:hypothetical protein
MGELPTGSERSSIMRLEVANAKSLLSSQRWQPNPAAEAALKELGRAVQPLFHAEEPSIGRDARSLFRRLLPDVIGTPRLLGAVPGLVASLLYSLDHLAPKYELQRMRIAAAWKEIEKAARI